MINCFDLLQFCFQFQIAPLHPVLRALALKLTRTSPAEVAETQAQTDAERRAALGAAAASSSVVSRVVGWGLHSSTFQLNLSALYGIRGARRGYVARVKGVLGGV